MGRVVWFAPFGLAGFGFPAVLGIALVGGALYGMYKVGQATAKNK